MPIDKYKSITEKRIWLHILGCKYFGKIHSTTYEVLSHRPTVGLEVNILIFICKYCLMDN